MLLNVFRLFLAFSVIGVIVSQTVKEALLLLLGKPFQTRKTITNYGEIKKNLNSLTWLLITVFLVVTFLNAYF